MSISEYEFYGATNMITEFKAGRRYKIGDREYTCVAACGDGIALHSEKTLQVETVTQGLLENSVELPPGSGGYYEGEDIIVANVLPAKYLCRLAEDSHAIQMADCPRPSIVMSAHIRRPTPKPKTIRRPPTDQDAIDQPRRKCWVRNSEHGEWIMASLRAVLGTVGKARYVAKVIDCKPSTFCLCEIEVPNDN